jgi:ATP/ADP translocase
MIILITFVMLVVFVAKIIHPYHSFVSQNAEIRIIFTEDYVTLRPIFELSSINDHRYLLF